MADAFKKALHFKSLNHFPQPDRKGSEKVTPFSDEHEDKLRKALYDIFDLTPLELLILQGIMNQKSLSDIAKELEALFKANNKEQTRFHVFQLRRSILKKLPKFAQALLTNGQRKTLKINKKYNYV